MWIRSTTYIDNLHFTIGDDIKYQSPTGIIFENNSKQTVNIAPSSVQMYVNAVQPPYLARRPKNVQQIFLVLVLTPFPAGRQDKN